MNPSTNHLTTEQIYDLLALPGQDKPEQGIATHLHTCAECQQEVATLRSALTGFRVATTGLAATQQLTQPRRAPVPRNTFAGMSFQVFAASCATALVLITTSVTLFAPHHPTAPAPTVNSVTATRVAAESDDALLNGIEQDLSAPVAPSLEPLQVASSNASTNQQN